MFAQTLSPRVGLLALAAAGTLLAAGAATAADARQAYQAHRAACEAKSGQERTTCMREAGAALEESRRGGLTSLSPDQLRANAAQRCERVPADQRASCMALRSDSAEVMGSVEGGGVLRRATIRQVGEPGAQSAPMPPQQSMPVAPRSAPPSGTGLR